jgi:hypothetical protein
MASFKQYDIQIADYFDFKMTAEEELAFMAELGNNDALRGRYEEELQIRAILGNMSGVEKKTAGGTVVPLNTGPVESSRTPVVPFYRRFSTLAVAAIFLVAVIAIYLVYNANVIKTNIVAGTTTKKDTTNAKDSLNNTALPKPSPSEIASNTYAKLYQTYAGQDIPVQLSQIDAQYKNGRYGDVLKASDADVQQMGADDNEDQLNQYLQLYKGLAYLAQNNPAKASKQFDAVLHAADHTADQYYSAQWYSALAALKLGLPNRADSTAALIINSKSPYKPQAIQMHGYLSGK